MKYTSIIVTLIIGIAIGLLLGFGAGANDQGETPDERLKAALQEVDLHCVAQRKRIVITTKTLEIDGKPTQVVDDYLCIQALP